VLATHHFPKVCRTVTNAFSIKQIYGSLAERKSCKCQSFLKEKLKFKMRQLHGPACGNSQKTRRQAYRLTTT
jgi:hypothetical protein